MMNNGSSAGTTITPNTLNAISGVLNNASNISFSHHTSPTSAAAAPQSDNSNYIPSATTAATSHANGLFLLSQAHQELTKREEAQARANGTAPPPPPLSATTAPVTNGTSVPKRGTKRKSYDMSPPPPSATLTTRSGKRTRINSKSRGLSEDIDDDDDDDDDGSNLDDAEKELTPAPSNRRSTRKPETEEEKRRNFLERNRQGARFILQVLFMKLIFHLKLPSNVGSVKRHGLPNYKLKSNTFRKKTNVLLQRSFHHEMRFHDYLH
jgi:ATF/CREB family transcription factor